MVVVYSGLHNQFHPLKIFDYKKERMAAHPECPERVEGIRRKLAKSGAHVFTEPFERDLTADIVSAHDAALLGFFQVLEKNSHNGLPDNFPVSRNGARPESLTALSGYYCTDTGTPFRKGALPAILEAARVAVSGAEWILRDKKRVYGLCRPPGHHAGRNYYGGYCYLNNAAMAACKLVSSGKVAILDLDYHHGNGSQDIFYQSDAVFFVSIHADPAFAYPYYSGYTDETGAGKGIGCNKNFPLPLDTDGNAYRQTVEHACDLVLGFKPDFIIISLGCDTHRDDPEGGMDLTESDFLGIGQLLSGLDIPMLVVQEGGYNVEKTGGCVERFLTGLEWRNIK
ncbi:MAG: histone deacetylase family protein [Spirochaetales bacterium]|nr:histone deacetylase family protein [Spirochaetales bacterium]